MRAVSCGSWKSFLQPPSLCFCEPCCLIPHTKPVPRLLASTEKMANHHTGCQQRPGNAFSANDPSALSMAAHSSESECQCVLAMASQERHQLSDRQKNKQGASCRPNPGGCCLTIPGATGFLPLVCPASLPVVSSGTPGPKQGENARLGLEMPCAPAPLILLARLEGSEWACKTARQSG